MWASAGVGHRPRGAAGEAARLHFERATLTPSRGGGQHRSSAATTKLVGILVEACIKLHGCIGCGLNRSIRPLLDLTDGVLLGAGPRRLEKSRVKWRARGCLGRQVGPWPCPSGLRPGAIFSFLETKHASAGRKVGGAAAGGSFLGFARPQIP